MLKCKICGEEIEEMNLQHVFQFTLGNVRSGKFYGEKTLYYHINCLNNKVKTKLVAPMT